MDFKGKVVLITGASRGIGKSIAEEFAKKGAAIIVNYNNNDEAANNTLIAIEKLGAYGFSIKGDVSSYGCAKSIVEDVIKKFGKIDVLVNNAGISKVGLFIDMEEEDFDNVINTNLKGVFNISHNAVKYMLQKKSGSIINISSMWGQVGASCEAIYSASKGGINAFTKALGKELGPSGIRVNAIQPGVIDTEMNSWMSKEEKESIENEIPLMTFGAGEDIGKLAVFLASDEAKYITAQVITVDGGYI